MKKLTLLIMLFAIFSVACTAQKVEVENNWLTNMEEAQKIAAEKNVPILVNFTGSDWCGWCTKLDSEVFSTSTFNKYAKDNLVLVKLDFPRNIEQSEETKRHNDKYKSKFEVRGFPTILILDEKLEKLAQMGYQAGGPEKYIKDIEAALTFKDAYYDNTIKTDSGIIWYTSLEKAKDLSAKTGKKIFVDFTGSDWCGWCIKIDNEILSTDEFRAFAKENLIMLLLDFPEKKELPAGMSAYNRQIAGNYNIQGFPTILILDKEGSVLTTLGYEKEGTTKFINDIKASIN